MMNIRQSAFAFLLALACAAPSSAQAQPERTPLTMGTPTKGSCASEAPAIFTANLASAGLLAVVLTADTTESDLVLLVCDEDGQLLNSDARSDRDLQGNRGFETVAPMILEAGNYLVIVEHSSGEGKATFKLSAAFAAAPAFTPGTPDPDGRPTRANAVTVGKPLDDSLGEGDTWDWFAVRCEAAGTLTILTKAPNGDLKLEAYNEGNYRASVAQSDQDLQGTKGNESLNLEVEAGQTVYVRVATFFSGSEAVPYRLVTAMIPN
jgi:hypothetical protein